MVTDRSRWGRSDPAARSLPRVEHDFEAVLTRVAAAASAGVDIVHLREPDLPVAPLVELAAACVALTRSSDTLLVVNERIDIALAAGADGVHLRSDAFPAREARSMVPPGFVIGRSVHSLEELLREPVHDVDYVIAGTVFPTRSKAANHALLGLDGLATLVRSASVPVLAIGGIGLDRVGAVAATGAAGLAAIDLFGGPPASMTALLHDVRAAFRRETAQQAG
ncbi:MAG: thiamine phosphate synthase [Vicinamibacterales bacterium]